MGKFFIASLNISLSKISFIKDCVGASNVHGDVGPDGLATGV
jgi:hypothetical protein